MPEQYKCPYCKAVIGIDDVNAATDIALCRSCGKTTAFSMICGAAQIDMACLNKPPRWIRVERVSHGLTRIIYRRVSPVLLFLIPFTAIWSGGSIYGIYGSQLMDGRFDTAQSLFGIPFVIGTVILLGIIIFLMFNRSVVTLCQGEGTVFIGVGSVGWTRRFKCNKGTLVSLRTNNKVRVNEVPQQAILIRTDGADLFFGSLWKDQAKKFVAAYLMAEISQLR